MESSSTSDVLSNDDLLREILLRLPRPACLVLAALVCRAWRAIACDAAFLRAFRWRHHRPALLGYFHGCPNYRRPVFTPVVTAAEGDFEMQALHPSVDAPWEIRDACDGLLLLFRTDVQEALHIAVHSPSTETYFLLPPPTKNHDGGELKLFLSSLFQLDSYKFDIALLPDHAECGWWSSAAAFRVVLLVVRLADLKMGAWMYSRGAGAWSFVDCVVLPVGPSWLGTAATPWMDGLFYWVNRGDYILSVDIGARQLSVIQLPGDMRKRYQSNMELIAGEEGSSSVGVVGIEGNHFHVWVHRGDEQWVLMEDVDVTAVMKREMGGDEEDGTRDALLRICGIGEREGLVFAQSLAMEGDIFVLELGRMRVSKVEAAASKVGQARCRGFSVYPYTAPFWPRPL